jgi:hypothetical protein
MPNNYNDPNFLRRQREKREAERKAKTNAEAAAAQALQLNASNRQQAIDAKIQELLGQLPNPPSDTDPDQD